MDTISTNRSMHRANYTLELGIWHATCRECGHRVSDPVRRRAAGIYREHIKQTNSLRAVIIDLAELPRPEVISTQ